MHLAIASDIDASVQHAGQRPRAEILAHPGIVSRHGKLDAHENSAAARGGALACAKPGAPGNDRPQESVSNGDPQDIIDISEEAFQKLGFSDTLSSGDTDAVRQAAGHARDILQSGPFTLGSGSELR